MATKVIVTFKLLDDEADTLVEVVIPIDDFLTLSSHELLTGFLVPAIETVREAARA